MRLVQPSVAGLTAFSQAHLNPLGLPPCICAAAAKLRSLERCSAALLMGCSSGRLRAQQHYEPVGAVLAYLLAGGSQAFAATASAAVLCRHCLYLCCCVATWPRPALQEPAAVTIILC